MIARKLAGPLLGAALLGTALLAGCGGGGTHKTSVTPPNTGGTVRKPSGTVSLTIHFPSNAIHAVKRTSGSSKRSAKGASAVTAAGRKPAFLDGGYYGAPSPLIVISGGDILNTPAQNSANANSTVCVTASPASDGTQTVPGIPVYNDGGYVTVVEYQSGDPTTCTPTANQSGSIVTLAETPSTNYTINQDGSYYGYSVQGPQYAGGFGAGMDVAFSTLFPTGITLDGYASEYIYSKDTYNWYVADGSDDFANSLCDDEGNDLYFAAADANGVGVASAVTSVNPSSSLTGGFPSVLITNVVPGSGSPQIASGPVPGSIYVGGIDGGDDAGDTVTFTISLTDYLGNQLPTYTETATSGGGCG